MFAVIDNGTVVALAATDYDAQNAATGTQTVRIASDVCAPELLEKVAASADDLCWWTFTLPEPIPVFHQ